MSKIPAYQIRADYDKESIVIYQAYREAISKPAIEKNAFQPPFSFERMTWIKPSFLWMMERSNWGQKSEQEYILKIRIKRSGWDEALGKGILTHPEKSIYPNQEVWRNAFEKAHVHIQWDPERSVYGKKQEHYTIQVGISRHLIRAYVEDWILKIEDMRPLVKKINELRKAGQYDKAKKYLPNEKVYTVSDEIAHWLGLSR